MPATDAPFVMCTERLELRAMRGDDHSILQQMYADPEVSRFIGADGLTPDVVRRQATNFADAWERRGHGQSIVTRLESREAIGRVGLHLWEEWDELELGWVLARSSQGEGLAAEAARAWLGWARRTCVAPYLIAVIHPDNAASIRLATRLGFAFDRHDDGWAWRPTTETVRHAVGTGRDRGRAWATQNPAQLHVEPTPHPQRNDPVADVSAGCRASRRRRCPARQRRRLPR